MSAIFCSDIFKSYSLPLSPLRKPIPNFNRIQDLIIFYFGVASVEALHRPQFTRTVEETPDRTPKLGIFNHPTIPSIIFPIEILSTCYLEGLIMDRRSGGLFNP
jgi:hypothetical protein